MRTVGVEEELLLVDAGRHQPAPVALEMVAQAEAATGEADEAALGHELKQEQVEIGSSPQTSMQRLHANLSELRAAAAATAAGQGGAIAAIATNPWKLSPTSTPDSRYARMTEEFGLLAREQLTCGQHVHVSVDSRAEGVAVLDRIRGWLPLLIAISANSPYWQGQDTGYASFRTVLWGRWPTAGPSATFGDEAGYQRRIEELISSGAALDDGMIYFDARLSARYPTVEIRVADVCTDVWDAVLIAALARAMVDTAFGQWVLGDPVPQVSTALLRAASWRASRWGLATDLVDPRSGRQVPAHDLLVEVAETLAPALGRNADLGVVSDGLDRLRSAGTGADRQRAAYARRQNLQDVVRDAASRTLAG